MQTLPEWLTWWVVGGGAGVVAFALIALLEKWSAFKLAWDKLPSEIKRYASFALSALLGLGGFGAQVRLGYAAAPGDLTAWAEVLFSIVVAQVVYAGIKLARK
jgi:hypothetical protein